MTRQPPMTTAQREAVLRRDGICIAALLDKGHVCRDQWGQEHSPRLISRLTIEHVKEAPGMAIRADHSMTVAMCYDGNSHKVWGSANRELLRAYLAGVFATGWTLPERRAA